MVLTMCNETQVRVITEAHDVLGLMGSSVAFGTTMIYLHSIID